MTCIVSKLLQVMYCKYCNVYCKLSDCKKIYIYEKKKTVSSKLQALFEAPEVTSFLNDRRIEWRFNLAKAPWWGGFFERMGKSTKRCLKKQLGNERLTYEELFTVLIEVEAVLNSRPLTYVYAQDIEEPLNPVSSFDWKEIADTSCPPAER